MEQITEIETERQERPQFLSVICVLSFIGSGFWLLFSLVGMLAAGPILNVISELVLNNSEKLQNLSEKDMEGLQMISSLGKGMIIAGFAVSLLLASLSLFGAIKMWNLQKSGFILYCIANGLILGFNLLTFNIIGVLIVGGFIVMYAVNRKHLR